MAAIGSTLLRSVLLHTGIALSNINQSKISSTFNSLEAEKALRPLRDIVKDYMVYGLLLLALVLIPFTMLGTGTPINCNFCQVNIMHVTMHVTMFHASGTRLLLYGGRI